MNHSKIQKDLSYLFYLIKYTKMNFAQKLVASDISFLETVNLIKNQNISIESIYEDLFDYSKLPIVLNQAHLNEDIKGAELYQESLLRNKIRTLVVALVICLNIDINPPDVQKVSPYSKMEAWFDPSDSSSLRALETIGKQLQGQYERWQPKLRCRQCLDPTYEDVKKLCFNLRRTTKEDRILFHYNGHGVPRPTDKGEIWVFNNNFTKYIPLPLKDLHKWLESPAIYVFDCHNAGRTIIGSDFFSKNNDLRPKFDKGIETEIKNRRKAAALQYQQRFMTKNSSTNSNSTPRDPFMDQALVLAACREDEELPQNPNMPADMFTSCLTTPIKMALKWHWMKSDSYFPDYLDENLLDRIPGSHSRRLSLLGEVNWIFTAVTDTVAWCSFSSEIFQKIFRQDLLVASLFRNFLLAERIMRSLGCNPVSWPKLPSTYKHQMWNAWDHAMDRLFHFLPSLLATIIEGSINPELIAHPILNPSTRIKDFSFFLDKEQLIKVKLPSLPLKNLPKKLVDKIEPKNFSSTSSKDSRIIQKAYELLIDSDEEEFISEDEELGEDGSYVTIPSVYRRFLKKDDSTTANANPVRSSVDQTGSIISCLGISSFFSSQMTAFKIWLQTADSKKLPPAQLPILLQVLLSQSHRIRALQLLNEFLDLGPWTVEQCLTVGVLPYIGRLFHSQFLESKPHLVLIWGKIMATASTEFDRNDYVRNMGYKFFSGCIIETERLNSATRIVAAFALSKMLEYELTSKPNKSFQDDYLNNGHLELIFNLLLINKPENNSKEFVRLRLWYIFGMAKFWRWNYEAYMASIMDPGMDKNWVVILTPYLIDSSALVRAATVYAFGVLIETSSVDVRLHNQSVDKMNITLIDKLMYLLMWDLSTLVRLECIVAFKHFVVKYNVQFVSICQKYMCQTDEFNQEDEANQKPNHFAKYWLSLLQACHDPFPKVSSMAKLIISHIREELVYQQKEHENSRRSENDSQTNDIPSQSSSSQIQGVDNNNTHQMNNKHPSGESSTYHSKYLDQVTTKYYEWSCKWFTKPLLEKYKGGKKKILKDLNSWEREIDFQVNSAVAVLGSMSINAAEAVAFSDRIDRQRIQMAYRAQARLIYHSVLTNNETRINLTSTSAGSFEKSLMTKESSQITLNLDTESFDGENMSMRNTRGRKILLTGNAGRSLVQNNLWRHDKNISTLIWHQYLPRIALADEDGVLILDTDSMKRLGYLSNDYSLGPKKAYLNSIGGVGEVSSLHFLNEQEEQNSLLLTTSINGRIRIWRNFFGIFSQEPEVHTAFTAFDETSIYPEAKGSFSSGQHRVISHWDQQTGQLVIGLPSAASSLRIFDINRESFGRNYNTNEFSPITAFARPMSNSHLILGGFQNGFIKLFDVRIPNSDSIAWIHRISQSPINALAMKNEVNTYASSVNANLMLADLRYSSGQNSSPCSVDDCSGFTVRLPSSSSIFSRSPNNKHKDNSSPQMSQPLTPLLCSSFKIDNNCPEDQVMVGCFGGESREIILYQVNYPRKASDSLLPINNEMNSGLYMHSSFKFYQTFSRESISTAKCVNLHPWEPKIAVGFKDKSLLILNMDTKQSTS